MRSPQSDNALLQVGGASAAEADLDALPRALPAGADRPAELYVWRAADPRTLAAAIEAFERAVAPGARPADVAYTLWIRARTSAGPLTLAVVAPSIEALRSRLVETRRSLASGSLPPVDPAGLFAGQAPAEGAGKVAFLFPGQGSQYPGMLRGLVEAVPEARRAFEIGARALAGHFEPPLLDFVFPASAGGDGAEAEAKRLAELTRTDRAQPALGLAGAAMNRALALAGIRPDMTAGHSYGEYVALWAAGVLDEASLARVSEARGRSILESSRDDLGTMAAVSEGPDRIAPLLAGIEGVFVANLNGPRQTVLSGTRPAIARAVEVLERAGIGARPIPVGCAFHSPLMAPARDRLAAVLDAVPMEAPRLPVYANSTGTPYPRERHEVAALLRDHLVRPVRFGASLEAMYRDGARVFIEAGPKNVLTGLVRQTLGSRPHLAIACDQPGRGGLQAYLAALAQLLVHGLPVDLEPDFRARGARLVDLAEPPAEPALDAAAAAAPPRPMPGAGEMQVMALFQETMRRFLETQRSVMSAYLGGEAAPASMPAASWTPAPSWAPAPSLTPAAWTPTPSAAPAPAAVMLPPVPPRPAAPGPAPAAAPITTGGPVTATAPRPVPAPAPAAPPVAAPQALAVDLLLEIASERTGYPVEMLGLDANLEADLGIDSIKRVEIIAAFRRAAIPALGDPPASFMERVTAAKTLRGIVAEVAALAESVRVKA